MIRSSSSNPSSAQQPQAQQKVQRVPLRLANDEYFDNRYLVSTFYRDVNFTVEFPQGKRVFLRKKTLEDEQTDINKANVDTDTKEMRERKQRLEQRKQKRQQEANDYLLREHFESKQRQRQQQGSAAAAASAAVKQEEGAAEDGGAASAASGAAAAAGDQQGKPMQRLKNSRWNRFKRGFGKRRRRRENYLLEDEEHQKTFEGAAQETEDDKYFIMILEKKEFKLIPVERQWVHFRALANIESENAAKSALIEKQLEQREKVKREQEDRFMSKYNLALKEERAEGETIETSAEDVRRRAAATLSRKRGRGKDDRDIDYDQNMSDDEEGLMGPDVAHDEYVEAPSDDEDDELERRMASAMGDESAGKLTDTGKHMKDILKKLKGDPLALEKALEEQRARDAAAKAAAEKAKAEAEAVKAEKKRVKEEASAAASVAAAASPAVAPVVPRETSIPTLVRETSIPTIAPSPTEEPAAKKQRVSSGAAVPTAPAAAAAAPAAPAQSQAAGSGISDPNTLREEIIKYLKQNGGNAPLKNVRKQFIPKSQFKTEETKSKQVNLLVQVLKAISKSENQVVFLKPEFM